MIQAFGEADVGHIFKKYQQKTLAVALGLLSLSAITPWLTDAQASTAQAQMTPAISRGAPLARDANTFESDKMLNAACRKSGASNSAITREICLCVTHVFKYELTLAEYRAAVQVYGVAGSRTPLYATLREQGISTAEINTAEQMEQDLTSARDFEQRCAEAKAYYK